ncbi:MAG: hypothetical protein SCH98_15465 [Deferrisomatales bacterium]|nr:hypothetical protein [Deferrisomatales bacterium]
MSIKDLYFCKKLSFRHPMARHWLRTLADEAKISADELQSINTRRCLQLARYAITTIPFYMKKYTSAGIEVGDIKDDAAFARLPILTKHEVRNHAHEMIRQDDSLDNLATSATGGSTGEPVRFYRDPGLPGKALGWHRVCDLGVSLADNHGVVGRILPKFDWKYNIACLYNLTKTAYLDAKTITSETMQRFYPDLKHSKATYIYGYGGGIYEFSKFLSDADLVLPTLKAIIATSSPLAEFQRAAMERTFKCKVYDQYGCCEVPWLAMECQAQEGLHAFHSIRRIEIVDENQNRCRLGQVGDILITNAIDYRFPIIRYALGDRSAYVSGDCLCENHSPRIETVRGRVTDCFTLPNGVIAGDYLTTIFDDYPEAVSGFQVYQYRDLRVELRVVLNSHHSESRNEVVNVGRTLEERLQGLPFQLKYVNEIPHEQGKTRFVINENML